MNPVIQFKTTTLPLLIALTFACFGPLPITLALLPPPDGGYPNGNTAEGDDALLNLTSGTNNTAIGFEALLNNTTGFQNTATGFQALERNTTGSDNTANGFFALGGNRTGFVNTAIGGFALGDNTTGGGNTATGFEALESNRAGDFNTATGFEALLSNTTGRNNTAAGLEALAANTTGNNNTAMGQRSLSSNTTGNFNIALGPNAGDKLTTGANNIDIGNRGVAGEADTIRIGDQQTQTATFIAGIIGAAVAGPVVHINSSGQLGVPPSSARFKDEIKPMDKASEAILALKPVTFHYKHELDPDGIPQFGLVAEDVEKVNPDLVVRDAKGEIYTVRYEAVNAMLLNEFLKEHRKVQQQEATIVQIRKDFRATVAQLAMRLDEQAAQIQKVSAQLEVNKTVPQIVLNNQ